MNFVISDTMQEFEVICSAPRHKLGKSIFQTSLLHLYCKHDDIYGFTLYLFVIKK